MSAPIATLGDMLIRRAVVAGVLASLVLTGCGAAEKLSPRVAVREAAERTKDVGIGFIAAQVQARGDVERHLMTTVRHHSP